MEAIVKVGLKTPSNLRRVDEVESIGDDNKLDLYFSHLRESSFKLLLLGILG
jgi:hypothetical protein